MPSLEAVKRICQIKTHQYFGFSAICFTPPEEGNLHELRASTMPGMTTFVTSHLSTTSFNGWLFILHVVSLVAWLDLQLARRQLCSGLHELCSNLQPLLDGHFELRVCVCFSLCNTKHE